MGFSSDVLAPSYQDFSEEQAGVEGKLSRDFQDFIMHVYPLFENKATADSLTLERLAHVTGKRPTELAELIAANTYKSPRLLTLRIRLHKAAEQLLTTGRDTKNVVIIVLNEKEEGFSLVSITPVVEGSEGFGGVKIDVKTDIPADAKVSYDVCMAGFVGSDVEPFALLATQITKGTDYIFAAESKVVAPGTSKKVVLLTTNEMTKSVKFETILG
jgi:AraC-like DNA-binding protein